MPNSALAAAFACFLLVAPLAQQSTLDRPLQTTLAPLAPLGDRETIMIPRMILKSAKVPVGFEQAGPLPPSNGLRTPQPIAGMTMRQVLDLIIGLDPRYTWREVDGVAVVRPSTAWNDPDDTLNRRVQNIHWTAVNARQTLDRLTSVVFDTPPATVKPTATGNPSTFAVDIADGTVIQVLNAAAKAGGLFWWTQTEKTPSGSQAVMVSLASFEGGGPVVTWPPQIHVAK
jgi:hypothetical protein